jgi:hypothetical protein
MSSPQRPLNTDVDTKYHSYGSLATTEEETYIDITPPRVASSFGADPINSRRWSVGKKLRSRYYCRLRSCDDCLRILSMKCVLAIAMLAIFTILAIQAFNYFLFSSDFHLLSSSTYDYIVVGAGPSGSLLTRYCNIYTPDRF